MAIDEQGTIADVAKSLGQVEQTLGNWYTKSASTAASGRAPQPLPTGTAALTTKIHPRRPTTHPPTEGDTRFHILIVPTRDGATGGRLTSGGEVSPLTSRPAVSKTARVSRSQ